MPTLGYFYSTMVLKVITRAIRQHKSHPNQKGRNKLSLFADDMILYIENSKDVIKKKTGRTIEKNNIEGYKINVQKSVIFLDAKSELSEKDIRKTFQFAIVPKRIKYLGINLTKEVKDLYTEDYKTLMKEFR